MSRDLSQVCSVKILSYVFGIVAFLIVGSVEIVRAQSPLGSQPVYDPASKSYFDLFTITKAEQRFSLRREPEVTWRVADGFAQQKSYKGVRGRLAIIRNPETYFFLSNTFRTSVVTWIGLRYVCAARELEWVDGQRQSPSDFQAWDDSWSRAVSGAECRAPGSGAPYMPIAISPATEGFRWFADGYDKEYAQYFVEYPTGHP